MADAPNSPLASRVITRRLSVQVARRAARQAAGYIGLFGACAISTGSAGSLQLDINLYGSSSIVSGSSGSLSKAVNLSSSVSIATGASGSLSVNGQNPLAGSSAITTAASGSLLVVAALAGTSAATSGASGALVITKPLAGVSAITTGATGSINIGGQNPIAGTSAATSGASGALVVTKPLAGTSAITTSATGALALTVQIAGTSSATSASVGDFSLINNLAGTSAITTGATGSINISGQNPIAGTSAATSGASGALVVTKPLAGTSAITTGATGALSVSGGGSSAPTFVRAIAATAQQSADSISLSGLVIDGVNKLVLIFINSYKAGGSSGATSVTVGGNAATRFGSVVVSSTGEAAEVWRYIGPADGTVGVNADLPAGTAASAMVAKLFTGVNQTTPLANFASNTTTGATSISVNVTSTTSVLVFGSLNYYDANTYTAGAGQTEPTNFASHQAGYESVRTCYKAGASSSTGLSYTSSASAEMTLLGGAINGV